MLATGSPMIALNQVAVFAEVGYHSPLQNSDTMAGDAGIAVTTCVHVLLLRPRLKCCCC